MFSPTELNQLYRFAFSLTHDEGRAYDLLQGAVEKVLREKPHNALAYTKTVIRNRFYDDWRFEKRNPHESFESKDVVDMHSDLEGLTIQRDELQKLLLEIEPMDREILFRWAIEGMTFEEISKEMGMSRGTLLSRISRLRSRIGKEVKNG